MTKIVDKYFNIERSNSSVILELNYMIFLENESYSHKEKLRTTLDDLEKDSGVDVIIISNNHPDFSMDNYRAKWNSFYEGAHWESNILRVFRTYDELFIKVKSLKKSILFMSSKAVNSMLFNFSMVGDLRFISSRFVVDNSNQNMVNIPKGGSLFNNSSSTYRNPFKLMFLLKEIEAETLYKRQLVDRVYEYGLKTEVLQVADHLSTFDYIELDTIKIVAHNRLSDTESRLQKENEFLLSCIRTKINQQREQ